MNKSKKSSPLFLLGIPFYPYDLPTLLKTVSQMIDHYPKNMEPSYIATINTDFYSKSLPLNFNSTGSKTLKFLQSNKINTIDGMPILWMMKLLGEPQCERITGADLLPELLSSANKNHYSIYLLGNSEEVNQKAVKRIHHHYPHVKIAGYSSPYLEIGSPTSLSVVEEINAKQPDLLFISLGHPKQELWFESVRNTLKVPISVGIGGSLNFFTGEVSRAPKWVQKIGCEWIYRLYQEPSKLFKRYLIGGLKWLILTVPILTLHLLEKVSQLFSKEKESSLLTTPSAMGSLFKEQQELKPQSKKPQKIQFLAKLQLKLHRIWKIN